MTKYNEKTFWYFLHFYCIIFYLHEYPARNYSTPALSHYIDGLGTESIKGVSEAHTVDFCLAYGSGEQEDALLEVLDAELRATTEVYVSDLEKFLSTAPDYGLPSFIDIPGDARPQHQSTGWTLDTWLEVAKKYLPGAENESMEEIVACITLCFDPEQFNLAIPVLFDESTSRAQSAQSKLDRRARELSGTTTHQLLTYTTSIATIRQFLDSSFMQTFGSDFDRIVLQTRILELQGQQLSPAYSQLVLQAEQGFSAQDLYAHPGRLSWILQHNPEAALRLIDGHPQIADQVRSIGHIVLSNNDSEGLTGSRFTVLRALEKQISHNTEGYASLVWNYFKKTGYVEPEHLDELSALVETSDSVNARAYQLLCVHLPIDEVTTLIARHPDLVNDSETNAICVRRFASAGHIEKAYELARTTSTLDSMQKMLEPLRNLLAIYDETGDEAAFQESMERLEAARNNGRYFYLDEGEAHDLLARTFVAARKHNHTSRAQQTVAEMEQYYVHKYSYVRDKALSRMLRIALDDGDLQMAEHFATRLYASREQSHDKRDRAYDGLLHVLQAYVRAGNMDAATTLVQTHFATDKPDSTLRTAMAILNNEEPRYMPRLYVRRLNPITDLLDS